MRDVGSAKRNADWSVRACAALWVLAVTCLWVVCLVVATGCGASDGGLAAESFAASTTPEVSGKSQPTLPAKPQLLASAPKPARIQRTSGTVSLARAAGRTIAYVADEDARALLTVDVESGKQLAKTSLGATPSSVLTLPDGRVLVTLSDVHRFAVLIPASSLSLPLRAHSVVPVPTEPTAIAATPLSDRALVVSRWGAKISEVKMPAGGAPFVARSLKLDADPFAAVVSRDGKQAFVSHVTGGKVSRVDLNTWSVSSRDHSHRVHTPVVRRHIRHRRPLHMVNQLDPFGPQHPIALPKHVGRRPVRQPVIRRTPVHGFAMVSHGDDVIIPVSEIFPGEPQRISTGYGSSVISERPVQERLLELSTADNVAKKRRFGHLPRCRIPRAAASNREGKVFVVCQGDSTVVSDGGWGSVEVPAGPTGLAWDEQHDRLVVWSQQARQLSVVNAANDPARPKIVNHAMPFVSRDPLVTHGRELFFATDRRISKDGRSCASCHPGGRQDGLVWSTPNGPRQTPMLAGKLSGTAPYGWNGGAKSIDDHLTQTFKRLGGKGLGAHDQKALVAYVKSLRVPTKAPDLSRKQLVAKGKAIFHSEQAECSSCHVEKRSFSDTMSYPIVRASADQKSDFNTPALVGLANTAPYFHDGRFPTLLAMLDGTDGKMGHSSHLSRTDKEALVAYLESL